MTPHSNREGLIALAQEVREALGATGVTLRVRGVEAASGQEAGPDDPVERLGDHAQLVVVGGDSERLRAILPLISRAARQVTDSAALVEARQFRDVTLSSLAHDLRGPLNVITFAASMLRTTVQDDPGKGLVVKVRRGARTMERMLRDLMDLAGLESIRLHRSPTDVAALISKLKPALEAVGEETGVRVSWVQQGEGSLDVDSERLSQALVSLTAAAAKQSAEGAEVRITFDVRTDPALLSIEDGGKAVPEERRARLFEAFARGDDADARSKGASLALAYGLLVAHGHSVDAKDSDLGGLRIDARLPRA